MSFPNHINFGLLVTNISLALFNISILNSPALIFSAIFFSLLPDIDNPRSKVGKMFKSLSSYIYSKYGHRTITHSAFAIGLLFIFIFLLEFKSKKIYCFIFLSSYSSHIILDSLTIEGVYFFFPNITSKIVMFSNPNFRLKSGYKKHEISAFLIILMLNILVFPFCKKGLNNFIKSKITSNELVFNISNSSDFLTFVEYDFTKNGANKRGIGVIIESTKNETILFDKDFITINSTCLIKRLEPFISKVKREVKVCKKNKITLDELNKIIKDKVILVLRIRGKDPLYYNYNNSLFSKSDIFITNVYDISFKFKKNTAQITSLKKNLLILEERYKTINNLGEKESLISEIFDIRKKIEKIEKEDIVSLFDIEIEYLNIDSKTMEELHKEIKNKDKKTSKSIREIFN